MKRLFFLGALALIGCGGSVTTDPYSNCPYQVYRQSPTGWLLNDAEVRFVFWGSYWQNNTIQQQSIQNQWNFLYGQGHVFQRLSEYGIQQGILDSNFYTTNLTLKVPGNSIIKQLKDAGTLTEIDDQGISSELNLEIQDGVIPYPKNNTLYVIFLPPQATTVDIVKNGWGGYHNFSAFGKSKYAYAIIGYNSDWVKINVVTSHEMYEAFTNPDLSSGYYDHVSSTEIGDLCQVGRNLSDITTVIDGAVVQKVWSQATCQCF